MKIGIIHPYFDVTGGAEMISLSLIDTLLAKKIQLSLYCVIPPKINETNYFSIHKVKEKKIPMFWRLQKIMELKQLFNLVSDDDILFVMSGGLTMEKVDAKKIYVYCNSTFSSEIKFTKKEFRGIKGIYLKKIQNNFKKSLKYLKNNNIELVTNSEFTKKEIEKNLGKKSRIIYPPVDVNKFLKSQDIKKEQKVVTVSRFSIEKNLDDVIEIFNKTGFPCELVGNSKHKNQFRVLEQLQAKKRKNVEIYNNISKIKISQLLSHAKVYLHTSQETFGISVVESIAAGCIPIVPDNSAHKETVPFEELRYKENEIEDAVKKINYAMEGKFDEFLPKLLSHIEKFSIEIFQKNIINLLENKSESKISEDNN